MKDKNSSIHPIFQKIEKALTTHIHSDLKFQITFGNRFEHLIVGNMSIVLNFHQKRPVFA